MAPQNIKLGFLCFPFRFTGNGLEYFRIWIVNVCLSIITLGIYSAWAKVRTTRYFYSNTIVDTHSFSYLADPIKILKGRLVAVAMLAIYFFSWQFYPQAGFYLLAAGLLLLPAIMIVALGFTLRNSAYRNIRFDFKQDFGGVYRVFLPPLILLLALTWAGYSLLDFIGWEEMLEEELLEHAEENEFIREEFIIDIFLLVLLPLIPYLDFLRTKFTVDHASYGTEEMHFSAGCWPFYKIYLLTLMYFIGMMIIFGILITISVIMSDFGNGSEPDESYFIIFGIGSAIVLYSLGFFVMGYWRAARTNLIYNHLYIGKSRLCSRLAGGRIGWIYFTNTLAIVLSLGMLIPWARVRMAIYTASCTELEASELDHINAAAQSERTALGEEFSDAFGLDLGI